MEKYFDTRLDLAVRKGADRVWQMVGADIRRRISPVSRVLDMGAGYGDFANQFVAEEKWAMDQWEGMKGYLAPSVRPVVGDIRLPSAAIPVAHFDLVFMSNVLEHFVIEDAEAVLKAARAYAKPGAYLVILQPNFRYCSRTYFDDYTHKTIFTAEGLSNFLLDQGFTLERVFPRYLPFSFKSRIPRPDWAVKLYLASSWKPLAAQMLLIARFAK